MSNFKEQKKYHFTYKTTNLINGRYYLGMHSTNHLKDGYMGSGKRLYYELNKYGRDNFKFEILEQFKYREELVQAEIILITEQDLKNPNCLNSKPGGTGGLSSEEHKQKFISAGVNSRKIYRQNPEWVTWHSHQIKLGQERVKYTHSTFTGKKHKDSTKKKIGETNSNKQKGENNSQYGSCWITNENENRKIKKGDDIPYGWRIGRIIKK